MRRERTVDDAADDFTTPRAAEPMKDGTVSTTGRASSRERPRSAVPSVREASMPARASSIGLASGAAWVSGVQELKCPEPIKPSFLDSEDDDCANAVLSSRDPEASESWIWFQVEVQARLAAIDAKVTNLGAVESKIDQLLKLAKEQADRPVPTPVLRSRPSVRHTTFALTQSSRGGSKSRPSISMMSPETTPGPRVSYHAAEAIADLLGNYSAADDASIVKEDSLVRSTSSRSVAAVDVTRTEERRNSYARRTSSRRSVKTWAFFEDEESSWYAGVYARAMFPFIIATVMVSLAQAIDEPVLRDNVAAQLVEVGIEIVFLLEVFARMSATRSWRTCLADPYNMIDLVSVLPLVLRSILGLALFEADGSCGMACTVLLGVVPVLRLLKLLRRFQNFQLLLRAFKLAFEALPVLLYIWTILGLLAAAGLYLVEPRDNVATLGVSIWLSVVSMTTLGYGDFYPVSVLGRLIVCTLVLCSALYMAIPLGIIGSAFSEVWSDRFRILLTERTRKRLQQAGYQARDIPFLFQQFDSDGDGCLGIEEFKMMVDFMQVGFTGSRVIELFELFDSDDSGMIDDRGFVRALFPESFHEVYGAMLKQTGEACSTCGNVFMQDSKFCRKCGTQRPTSPPAEDGAGKDGETNN
mmetsp:Transcript_133011/g.384693  ORF Transcript_133011/g.384693 Transcript_133011/m.384693 type:complete len:641 (+) Transcript_133011:47-1969(+)